MDEPIIPVKKRKSYYKKVTKPLLTPSGKPRKYKGKLPTERIQDMTVAQLADIHPGLHLKPGARRVLNIDEVKKLAEIGCTMDNIADFFNVSVMTLQENYSETIKQGRENLHQSLQLKQIQKALAGDTGLLIHLGKTLLRQKDIQEQQITIQQQRTAIPDDQLLQLLKKLDEKLPEVSNNIIDVEAVHVPENPVE
jgi:ASC-1-like (ASCH) protein